MGLNHDLIVMKECGTLSKLFKYILKNPEVADVYERHYTTILPPVLEAQFPTRISKSYADTQRLALSYMVLCDLNPSRKTLVKLAEMRTPEMLEHHNNLSPTPTSPPTVPKLKNPLRALTEVCSLSMSVETSMRVIYASSARLAARRQHYWETQFMNKVAQRAFSGSKADLRTELGIFGTKLHLGKLLSPKW